MKNLCYLLFLVISYSCSKSEQESIVGKWDAFRLETSRKDGGFLTDQSGNDVKVKSEEWIGSAEFRVDGTFINGGLGGSYAVDGNKINLSYKDSHDTALWNVTNGTLTLRYETGGFIMVFYFHRKN